MSRTTPSARSYQILDALCEDGRTRAQVARALGLSVSAVGHHVDRLRAHYAVTSTGALIATVLRQRLAACRLELARKTREVAALDRRGKPSTADVVGPPLGDAP